MYKKVETDLGFAKREAEISAFWKERGIVKKSQTHRAGREKFTFYEGPPTANGRPHIGHVITRAVKDVIPRHRSMKGYDVLRKAGWDTHGLPVELEVEKELGIDGKQQIEAYGVGPFIEKCKQSVWKYKAQWQDMSERVAFWADMDDPYVTYENKYIESVWWSLRQIWDKGLLYKGHKVVPYCPRCGTALSSHEVAQGYKDIEEDAVFVKFPVIGEPSTYIVAWTTTPWTLPSNAGLVVHPDHIYATVEWRGERHILAKGLIESVYGAPAAIAGDAPGAAAAGLPESAPGTVSGNAPESAPGTVPGNAHGSGAGDAFPVLIRETQGRDLVGMKYEPLFGFARAAAGELASMPAAWTVQADAYVTLEEGSGVVHAAPAFGEDDARVGRDCGLPFLQHVDASGRFVDAVEPWKGMFVKDADPLIADDLRVRGLLLRKHAHSHSYPFCWRCDTPLLYYARDTWFIRMTAVRDALVRNNDTVNWLPAHMKRGRFGNFLENVVDWGLSRERYWGTPLPIWECGCGCRHLVGSVSELREMGQVASVGPDGSDAFAPVPEDIELHKPHIDAVVLRCPKCGSPMKRVPEVIDCWYDAGSMPFAQWSYPFNNGDVFHDRFPAHFISEAVDQTRGWFYTLLAISTLLFDKAPFENCIVLGHVLDKDGVKMSKHKGNVVDPWDALDAHGADAVRWYFFANSSPWLPVRFFADAVSDWQRKFMGTLWNTYAFYALYAEIDQYDPTARPGIAGNSLSAADANADAGSLCLMDRWALSKLNSLIDEVDKGLMAYKVTEPARAITAFVDALSNWYVRRCRSRFWAEGMEKDKRDAYGTLYAALTTLAKLSAPFVPYVTEQIYQNLVANPSLASGKDGRSPESVHLCDYPVSDTSLIDPELEAEMDAAIEIVQLGRACRSAAGVKNRQPLPRIIVVGAKELAPGFARIVADELNVKAVEFAKESGELTTYRLKPQLKTLGPRYGRLVPKIGAWLAAADGNEAMRVLGTGSLVFEIDGAKIALSLADVLVETARKERYVTDSANGVTVALDTSLSEELIEEGFVRELISKIQTMRREAGFEVQDRIEAAVEGDSHAVGVFTRRFAKIADETLIDSMIDGGLARAVADANAGAGVWAGAVTGAKGSVGAVDAAPALGEAELAKGARFGDGAYAKSWSINSKRVTIAVRQSTARAQSTAGARAGGVVSAGFENAAGEKRCASASASAPAAADDAGGTGTS